MKSERRSRRSFHGQPCAYCGRPDSSAGPDHVFARAFFPVDQRGNLPCVPACKPCNQAKADLELFATTVLPFGGSDLSSSQILTEMVPKRLAGNRKLHRHLAEGQVDVLIQEGDISRPTFAIPLQPESITSLFAMIARGLASYHLGQILPETHVARAGMFSPWAESRMRQLFCLRAAAVVRGSPGGGTFRYEGVQAVDDPYLTIWRFQVYGGMIFAGDSEMAATASDIWAVISHRDMKSFFDLDEE